MSPESPVRVRILGIGMGPQHVTPEVASALRGCDYVIAAEKSADDRLLAARRAVAEAHDVEVVAVPDPDRDRTSAGSTGRSGDYRMAVRDWHAARVAAYEQVLRARGGTAAFLVWGDASLFDSTVRVVDQLSARLPITYDVLPGISAPQALAAAHRIVLHEIGRPVHITTARRLREDIAAGQRNLCVMLNRTLDLPGLEDWSIWWGANLGTDSAALVSGSVGDVLPDILRAREQCAAQDGWVMDIYLLRAPESLQ